MAQIFTNLTLNAIHAMPQGGSLVVSTGLEGDEIYVRFQDSGVGIPPEHRARIFEPFFTTKATGEGTGLGLAVCQSLISRHRGRITVDSEVGQGSTFTVWLPPAPDKESIVGGFVGRG
jgi:signal transduction histidine kinase